MIYYHQISVRQGALGPMPGIGHYGGGRYGGGHYGGGRYGGGRYGGAFQFRVDATAEPPDTHELPWPLRRIYGELTTTLTLTLTLTGPYS